MGLIFFFNIPHIQFEYSNILQNIVSLAKHCNGFEYCYVVVYGVRGVDYLWGLVKIEGL